MRPTLTWPEGKRFAFTIFDDAGLDCFSNTKPVYDFLTDLGLRTTKSCWLEDDAEEGEAEGISCQNLEYLRWLMDLQDRGFEIGWHQARASASSREVTQRCLQLFKLYFGYNPRAMSNHGDSPENMYGGVDRFDSILRWLYRLAGWQFNDRSGSEGHKQGSSYFWGDLCQRRIQYCRGFVFPDINSLMYSPNMPYRDERRPYVNQWFSSSNGTTVDVLNQTLSEAAQDRLESEGGACILSTQFGNGFCLEGKLNARFQTLMQRLAEKEGWFVPVSTLLDYLATQPGGGHDLTPGDRYRLQWNWLKSSILGR